MTNGGRLTSSPFDVPGGAQLLTYDVGTFSGSACLTGYIWSGPDYATSSQLKPSDCGTGGWRTRSVNITGWAGQSIKLELRGSGSTAIDNVGVMEVAIPDWDVTGSSGWIPLLLPDGPDGNYASVPNGMAPITASFLVPQGQVTLSYDRRVVSGLYNVYVRCAPTFARCGTIVQNDKLSIGQWLNRQVSLSGWSGQVVQLEFYNAGTLDIDSVNLIVP